MEEKVKKGFTELLLGQKTNDVKCFEKAKLCFQEILENDPIDATILSDAYRGLGITEYELLDFSEAITNLSNSINAQSSNGDIKIAYFYRGKANLKFGLTDSCCEDFKFAVALGYNDTEGIIKKYCKE